MVSNAALKSKDTRSEYVYAVARHVTRIEVREVKYRIVIRRIFGIGETLHCRNVNNRQIMI